MYIYIEITYELFTLTMCIKCRIVREYGYPELHIKFNERPKFALRYTESKRHRDRAMTYYYF